MKLCANKIEVDIPPAVEKTIPVLDMENDRVMMFKEPVPLEFTGSGHYCVDTRDHNNTRSQS